MSFPAKKVPALPDDLEVSLDSLVEHLERLSTVTVGDMRWVLAYRESLLGVLVKANELRGLLPEGARAAWHGSSTTVIQEKLANIAESSSAQIEDQWKRLGNVSGERLEFVIGQLKQNQNGRDFKRRLRKLLPLLPYYFSPTGVRRPVPLLRVAPSEIASFRSGFGAQMLAIISKRRGLGELADCLVSEENRRRKGEVDYDAFERLLLARAELPSAFFRGPYGDDCSSLSVPLYPILRGVRTYWIYAEQEEGPQILGYVLVVEASTGGKALPLVLTIAGPGLNGKAAQRVIRLVAADFEVSSVLLPPPSVSNRTHGGRIIRDEINRLACGPLQPIQLPEGWDIVDKFHLDWRNKPQAGYSASELECAVKVLVGSASVEKKRGIFRTPPKRNTSDLQLICGLLEGHFGKSTRGNALARVVLGSIITSREWLGLESSVGSLTKILESFPIEQIRRILRPVYQSDLSTFERHRSSAAMRKLVARAYAPVDPFASELLLNSPLTSKQARHAMEWLRLLTLGDLSSGPKLLRELEFLPTVLRNTLARPTWLALGNRCTRDILCALAEGLVSLDGRVRDYSKDQIEFCGRDWFSVCELGDDFWWVFQRMKRNRLSFQAAGRELPSEKRHKLLALAPSLALPVKRALIRLAKRGYYLLITRWPIALWLRWVKAKITPPRR